MGESLSANKERSYDDYLYDIFRNIDGYRCVLPKDVFVDKDRYDQILDKLFETIIFAGCSYYSIKKESDNTLSESNFLKKDVNYYAILKTRWKDISVRIRDIFDNLA